MRGYILRKQAHYYGKNSLYGKILKSLPKNRHRGLRILLKTSVLEGDFAVRSGEQPKGKHNQAFKQKSKTLRYKAQPEGHAVTTRTLVKKGHTIRFEASVQPLWTPHPKLQKYNHALLRKTRTGKSQ